MKFDRYYYITSLPNLGDLGSAPPIGSVELRDYLGDDRQRQELVCSLFLLEDLLQREAYLAGDRCELAPVVLSEKQIRDENPLPSYLVAKPQQGDADGLAAANSAPDSAAPAASADKRFPVDTLWDTYFRYVAGTAKRFRCPFLTAWVSYEVALRNALAAARARRLGLDEHDCTVALDLAEEGGPTAELLNDWEAAATPLAGQQALIRARWAWLAEHDGYYRFHNDELAAYALRLMLLGQWRRISGEGRAHEPTEGT